MACSTLSKNQEIKARRSCHREVHVKNQCLERSLTDNLRTDVGQTASGVYIRQ